MTTELRQGLALLCVAAVFLVFGLALTLGSDAVTDERFGSGVLAIAGLLGVGGLILAAKGLLKAG